MYAVMWSEHCSYKSSRVHLGRLPTEAPWVLVGPGENAGVVDVGDGIAAAIRIESHNHPSAIEPYQGAATGVGGILRDVFTMGARPIALMDPLRFGPLDDPRSRWIAEGVVSRHLRLRQRRRACPTVGGEVVFDETYAGNPLVNVLCLGVLPVDRLVLGRAIGRGQPGRAPRLDHRPRRHRRRERAGVRRVRRRRRRRRGQAAERAGRRSLRGEAAHRGVPGAARRRARRRHPGPRRRRPDLRHQRDGEPGRHGHGRRRGRRAPAGAGHGAVRGHDVARARSGCWPSSTPGDLDAVLAVCRRWEVRATVVGRVTAGGRLRILDGLDGEVLADVPAASLHEDAPRYDRPRARARPHRRGRPRRRSRRRPPADDAGRPRSACSCDPAWVYRQYDHQLFLNTVVGPGRRRHRAAAEAPRHRAPTPGGLWP